MSDDTYEDQVKQESASSSKLKIDIDVGSTEIKNSEEMILEVQKRVWGALKKGYEYAGAAADSEKFLRRNIFSKLDMVVIYVDLVGSTTMALELPAEKIAIIISSFAQEMSYVIRQHHGYVLKFVGDAVIGYFVSDDNGKTATQKAMDCSKMMLEVIQKGINPILYQYDYPDLMAKIGADYGQNIIVRYGADAENSHVDLMGPAMNIAAKIQMMAKPNQILIGSDVYERLSPSLQREFIPITWENNEWRFRSRATGEIYKVYEHKG